MTIGRKIYSLRECPQAVLDWKIDANPQPLPLTPLLDSSNYTSNPLTPPPFPNYPADITRPSSPVQAALPKSPLPSGRHKVAIVGSGSFGTALAKIVAKNVQSRPKEFHSEVRMWVREKIVRRRGVAEISYVIYGFPVTC